MVVCHTVVVIKTIGVNSLKHRHLPVKSVRGALVPGGILEQVFLVIILCIVPGPRCFYCCDNLLVFGSKMLLLHLLRHTTGNRLLLWCIEENGRAVFCVDEVHIKNKHGGGVWNARVPLSTP